MNAKHFTQDAKPMNWNDAIDYAHSKGMKIPNIAECAQFRLRDCWSSTTDFLVSTRALILNEELPVSKLSIRPVTMVMTDFPNIMSDVSHRTGDEGHHY